MHRSFSTSTACEVLLSQSKCSQDFRHATGLPVVEEGHALELLPEGVPENERARALDRLHLVRWPAAPRANRVHVRQNLAHCLLERLCNDNVVALERSSSQRVLVQRHA